MIKFLADVVTTTKPVPWYEMPAIIAGIVSIIGIFISSFFGYISSYFGNQQSQRNELKKIKENQRKMIEQQNKLEKDKSLRIVLQKLTYGYYQVVNDPNTSTYFNTEKGNEIFNDVMSYVTAYGSDQSVQTTIYLSKAIQGSPLLQDHYETLSQPVDYEVDWVRYETNALASLLIAQLRYDISQEYINPKDLLAVKYNDENDVLRAFFGQGVDAFIVMLNLHHFDRYMEGYIDEEDPIH